MASLDISPEIGRSYQKLVSGAALNRPSPTYAQWAVFSVSAPLQNAFVQSSSKASTLKVHTAGEGELEDLIEEFSDGKVQFAFVKIKDPNSGLPKFVLICWCGEGVPERVKGYFTGHLNAVTKVLHGYHVQVTARSESDLLPEAILQKVADASGSKYSSSSSPAPSAPARKPAVATKPVFQPTRATGRTLPVGPKAPYRRDDNVDADGWGADAPQVTRSHIEKVESAYKPTKVDINVLRSQPTSTTSSFSNPSEDQDDIVRGGYQPVGKIDIASLRKGYKEDRPEPVRGSYQPVDVGAIRKAPVARPGPESTPPSAPVPERSSAFSQSERLTSLPKPKVAKKFGPDAPSFGTKPLTPGGFGASPNVPPPPQIGSISKTGSTKSPAQIWAEKKARERGLSGASETTPPSVSPGAQYMSPTYTGASVSSQPQEEESANSAAGVSALRNRFSGAAPMGAPTPTSSQQTEGFSPATTGDRAPPPPPTVDTSSRPPFSAPTPTLPSRPVQDEQEQDPEGEGYIPVSIPPPPVQRRSPTPPTPEISGSPVRIAMPVARRDEPDLVTKPEEPTAAIPVASLSRVVPREEDLTDDIQVHSGAAGGTSHRAIVLYDYTADEENEIDLIDGQVVTNIDMVDEDWWRGTNVLGQEGLFPSNYVELIQGDGNAELQQARSPSPEPVPVANGRTALAIYDYEATEENELTFPDGAVINDVQFPDEDWWHGTYQGKEGLFPANYVELQD